MSGSLHRGTSYGTLRRRWGDGVVVRPLACGVVTVEIRFDRVGHLIRVPAVLTGGLTARFVIDTGIGITVMHPSLVGDARPGAHR